MTAQIKAGERFEVFECTDNTCWGNYLSKGFQSIGRRSPLMPNLDHVEILTPDGYFGYTLWQGEYKKVGTLVITRVK